MRLTILIALVALFGVGCAKPEPEAQFSWELYRSPDASPEIFKGASVAILPAVTIEDDKIYREALSGILYQSLIKVKNGPRIIPIDVVLSTCNELRLLNDYRETVKIYQETGMFSRKILSRLGRSLGARYILLPKLLRFKQVTFNRVTILGISFLKTRESTVDIHAQLWDTKSGKIIWHGAGEGMLATEVMTGAPASFMEVAQFACESLASRLPWVKPAVE